MLTSDDVTILLVEIGAEVETFDEETGFEETEVAECASDVAEEDEDAGLERVSVLEVEETE